MAPARISKLVTKPDDALYVGLEHIESWTGRLFLESQPASVDSVVSSFAAGDVLFGKLRPYLAKAARPTFDGVCTSEILPLRPNRGCVQSYMMYCLLNAPFVRWLDSLTYGAKMPRVSPYQVGNSPVPLPPESEQLAIIAFLDRETARIDALVARKERLIELLQEKRTALITRAVTRGLDPSVPMKDSGIEWLRETPANWDAVPFKREIDYVEGPGIMASDFRDEGVPLLRISGIDGRWVSLKGCNYLPPELVRRRWSHFQVRSGDLLISGSASTGFCSEVDERIAGAIPYTGIIIIRPSVARMSKDFVRWMLLSDVFATQVALARSGSTIQHFGPSHLSKMQIVTPPLSEQTAIAHHLDFETFRLDRLIDRVGKAIDHLNEFRTALISATVTGKIDVREEAS